MNKVKGFEQSGNYIFYCLDCGEFHYHGVGSTGYRSPHCRIDFLEDRISKNQLLSIVNEKVNKSFSELKSMKKRNLLNLLDIHKVDNYYLDSPLSKEDYIQHLNLEYNLDLTEEKFNKILEKGYNKDLIIPNMIKNATSKYD